MTLLLFCPRPPPVHRLLPCAAALPGPDPAPCPPARRPQEFWDSYQPPVYLSNRYVWVASAVVATALAYYSAYFKDAFLL